MKERPINLKAHEVLDILAGRKTQLRRTVKPQPTEEHTFQGWVLSSTCVSDEGKAAWGIRKGIFAHDMIRARCPLGVAGDRLWVRETFDPIHGQNPPDQVIEIDYKADGNRRMMDELGMRRWTPSTQMPRWASRITLEITKVSVKILFCPCTEQNKWFWIVDFKRVCNEKQP